MAFLSAAKTQPLFAPLRLSELGAVSHLNLCNEIGNVLVDAEVIDQNIASDVSVDTEDRECHAK